MSATQTKEDRPVLWNGIPVPAQFPYLDTLLHGRPRHFMDDFSFRHPQMDRGKRAKIFAPFDALDGYGENVAAKNTVYTDKIILDEADREELGRRLSILHSLTRTSRLAKVHHIAVTVKYYVPCTDEYSFACGLRGQYREETGVVWRVDREGDQTITVGHTAIRFDDILSITPEAEGLFRRFREE